MKRIAGYAVLALLAACRPDPGESDYENQVPSTPSTGGEDPDMLPGPFPYQTGQRRLGVGFYEGGRSDDIPVDNSTTFVYLYESTVTLEPSSTHVEGKSADLVVHAGKAWLGFGVHWNSPRNLSTWKTLHVSLRSSDPGFALVEVGMSDDTKDVKLNVEKYGYDNDGQWHHLAIPLTEFTAGGLKLGVVDAPFIFVAGSGAPADKLLLDNLYFTAE
ncbi:hypothetical protein NR798_10400 [Archangium gephyra]|uniref:hypothetical protein n=1 Tax=Archangium gephyra TaxID=48 RepID=UPI0035D45BC9